MESVRLDEVLQVAIKWLSTVDHSPTRISL